MNTSVRGRDRLALLGAVSAILYFLVPVAVPPLGFSLHVIPVVGAFVLLFTHPWATASRNEYVPLLAFLIVVLLSMMAAPELPMLRPLRTWAVSLAMFWLLRHVFLEFSHRALDRGVSVLLFVWSLAALLQVLVGEAAYVSSWYGAPLVTVYATGMTIFSNNAAVMLVPLLIWVLVRSLESPSTTWSLLWVVGWAALYFTLSRAGWLAMGVGLIVVFVRVRGDRQQVSRLVLHMLLALLSVVLAWSAPTRIDAYEPGGSRSGERWISVGADQDYSATSRLVTFRVAQRAVMEHPLTGIGLGRFPDYYVKHHEEFLKGETIDPRVRLTPHNGYAQFAAENGIPAFFALFLWVGILIVRVAKVEDPTALAVVASLAGLGSWLLFHDGLYLRLLWLLLGCAAAIGATRSSQVRSSL